VPTVRLAPAPLQSIALHAALAIGGSIALLAVSIAADDVTAGEIIAGYLARLANQTGILCQTQRTASNAAQGHAPIARKSVAHGADLTGSAAVARHTVGYSL